MDSWTTIRIKKKTKDVLRDHQLVEGETYDSVINRIINKKIIGGK